MSQYWFSILSQFADSIKWKVFSNRMICIFKLSIFCIIGKFNFNGGKISGDVSNLLPSSKMARNHCIIFLSKWAKKVLDSDFVHISKGGTKFKYLSRFSHLYRKGYFLPFYRGSWGQFYDIKQLALRSLVIKSFPQNDSIAWNKNRKEHSDWISRFKHEIEICIVV